MDIHDPNQWTTSFVRENRNFCLSFLQETNQKVMDCLFDYNYNAAIAGLDRMLNGAIVMQNAGIADMRPFLSSNSFYEGVIITCGIKNAPESKLKETAVAAFSDARDFASSDLKYTYSNVLAMFQSGRSLSSIANQICPNFPDDIIKEMLDTNSKLQKQKDGSGNSLPIDSTKYTDVPQKKRKWVGTLIAVIICGSIAMTLLSNFVNNRPALKQDTDEETLSENISEKNTDEKKGEIYFTTAVSGLNLRSEASLQSESILLIPYKADVEVFEINNGWAYVKYNNERGYCSSDYLSNGDKESYVSEYEWKNAYLEYVRKKNAEINSEYGVFNSYSLIYIDDDNIPELYLEGIDEAHGVTICTYSNGAVQDLKLLRLWGSSYIPKTGLIKNSNGNMGEYEDVVYKLENGTFKLLLRGERLDDPRGIGEPPEFIIDNVKLEENEYENRFNSLFASSNAVRLEQGNMTYEQLLEYLSK